MVYRLAQNIELQDRDGESFLMAKAPLRVLRLNRALAALVRQGMTGDLSAATPGEAAALEQLAARGFVERIRPVAEPAERVPTVSVIIPVKDREEELLRCLGSLRRLTFPQDNLQIIVVDDGSSDSSAHVAQLAGAEVVPSGGTGLGPAAARNAGAAHARGDILAFIDSDCTASEGWLTELLPVFKDPAVTAVGGLVDGMCTESAIDRYERVMSSLTLGKRERSGSGGNDTFYLPSCNLLVRRTVFASVGGFDDSMHVGEDVDLTWRFRDRGWTIAYLPAGRVYHEHRSTLRSFMSRRFDYGTSEGMLQRLHPLRRKQMVIPPLLALVLALLIAVPLVGQWCFLAAAGVLAADATLLRVRLKRRGLPLTFSALMAGRLRAIGSLAYYLCFHLVRYYSIPLAAVSVQFPPMWGVLAAALACAAGVDYAIKKPSISFPQFAVIYLLEDVAYGAGVFWGCLNGRSFTSYRVTILRHREVGG